MNEREVKSMILDPKLTDGQQAVEMFNLYIDLATNEKLPNIRRFEKEFLEAHPNLTNKAPYYFMFCFFIGGLDFAEAVATAEQKTKRA